jgi:hypothetical protein
MKECESNNHRAGERQEERRHMTVKFLDVGIHHSLILDLVSGLFANLGRDCLVAVQILVCLQGSKSIT